MVFVVLPLIAQLVERRTVESFFFKRESHQLDTGSHDFLNEAIKVKDYLRGPHMSPHG